MTRRSALVCSVLLLGLVPACGGRGALEPGPGEILLRYDPAAGSTVRYHTVLRDVPGGRPGRTVSATSAMSFGRDAEAGVHALEVAYTDVHLAGEGGSAVEVPGEISVALRRDELHGSPGEIEVQGRDVEAAADLVRHLTEGLVFPRLPFGVGDTWALPPIERPLPGGRAASFEREARLVGVDEGVARVAVTGSPRAELFELGGARVAVAGELEQHFDVRVADGLLIEAVGETELRLRSTLPDGTEIGTIAHRTQSRTRRLRGAAPDPAAHDWRPDRPASACMARLGAMERRFARAPRQVDLGGVAASDMSFPVRGDARDVDEAGPVIVGVDEETILGGLGGTDLRRAVVAYLVAPVDVSDEDLRTWLGTVPSTVELRRLAIRQVNPPSPPSPPAVEALAAAMRSEGGAGEQTWSDATSALVALCDEARDVLEAADDVDASDRPATLRAGLHGAFERCGCDATDLQRLERTLDLRFGGPHVGWVPL